jgi:hypothetical protein
MRDPEACTVIFQQQSFRQLVDGIWAWGKDALFGIRRRKTPGGGRFPTRVGPPESLEDRMLLSAAAVVDPFVLVGRELFVNGTSGDDLFNFAVTASELHLSINGAAQSFAIGTVDSVHLLGGQGTDKATLTGGAGKDVAKLYAGFGTMTGSGYALDLTSVESIQANGGVGDVATLLDSSGADTFVGRPTFSSMTGPGYSNLVRGFGEVYSYSRTPALDVAWLYDSKADDTLVSRPTYSSMRGSGFFNYAAGFGKVYAYANEGGTDSAWMYDSAGDDTFTGRPTYSLLSGAGFANYATNFDLVYAYANNGGNDKASLYGSTGDDTFAGNSTWAYLAGSGFYYSADGFDLVAAYAETGANDTAWLYDSAGNDTLVARPSSSSLSGAGFSNGATSFDRVYAYSIKGGADTAWLYDSSGDDILIGRPTYAQLYGTGFNNFATGFARVNAYGSSGGKDRANLYDSGGDDAFVGRATYSYLSGAGYYNLVQSFDEIYAYAEAGGKDTAWLYDSAGNDTFVAATAFSELSGSGFLNRASGFGKVYGYANGGGADIAWMYDSAGDDTFIGRPTYSVLMGMGYENYATSFDKVYAYSRMGGRDKAFLYDAAGDDTYVGRPTYSYLSGDGYYNLVNAFAEVYAYAGAGGNDTAWLYDSAGDDVLMVRPDYTRLGGAGYYNFASRFGRVYAYADAGGNDTAWLYGSAESDTIWGRGADARIAGSGFNTWMSSFDAVRLAQAPAGEDLLDINAIGYVFTVEDSSGRQAFEIGSGILFPQRIVADQSHPGHILVLTGSGEYNGEAWLYRLDAQTLTPIGDPLRVGENGSDVTWVGSYLVVASRGSSELYLVDPLNWSVLDHVPTIAEPISLAALPGERVAVASIRSDEVQSLKVENNRLVLLRSQKIDGIAYDVTATPDGQQLFVNLPVSQSIIVLDANTLQKIRTYAVGGAPSYGGLMFNGHYVATDRDGYIHFISLETGEATRVDLAVLLQLDRNDLPIRGIDPKELIQVDAQHLLVVNDRQDSILLRVDFDGGHVLTPTVVARGHGAASGAYLGDRGEVLLTQPSNHQIDRILVDPVPANGVLSASRIRVGVGITNAVRVQTPSGPLVVVVLSDDTLHIINEQTGQMRRVDAPAGFSFGASLPIQADDAGNLLSVVFGQADQWRLLRMTADGVKISDYPIALGQVFSLATRGDHAIVVDRLAGQVQSFNLATGATSVVTLARTRPREGVVFADGSWLVIHDTNPDIGVSVHRDGVTTFSPYSYKGRWLIEVTDLGEGRVLLADFGGKLVEFDARSGTYGSAVELPFDQLTYAVSQGNQVWAISATHGQVAVLDADTLTIEDVFNFDGAQSVLPMSGDAGWLLTGKQLWWLASVLHR